MNGERMTERYLSPMTGRDLDEVMAIERSAYEFPWTRGNFEDALRSGYDSFCLRNASGMLLGYCVLMLVVDEMHLLNLCIAPFAQRQRAGWGLLRETTRIARARQTNSVLLEVRLSNLHARHLYERFGFVEIGRRKHYYPARHCTREDAVAMRYQLDRESAYPDLSGAGLAGMAQTVHVVVHTQEPPRAHPLLEREQADDTA